MRINNMKVLMSIKPKFVKQILAGTKLFELRKRNFKLEVKTVIIYESSPTKKIVGEFIIDKIIRDTPQKIYLDYSEKLGISKKEYFEYFRNINVAYAIKIKKVIKYEKELTLSDFNIKKAPQSYQYIK
jgi:lj965 prophage protein